MSPHLGRNYYRADGVDSRSVMNRRIEFEGRAAMNRAFHNANACCMNCGKKKDILHEKVLSKRTGQEVTIHFCKGKQKCRKGATKYINSDEYTENTRNHLERLSKLSERNWGD